MELGERIRQKRKEMKLSLASLSDLTNIDKGYLSKIENNKNVPTIDTLEVLAKTLEVHISYFFGEKKELPNELEELGVEWLAVTKEAKAQNLTPEELRQAIQFVKNIRGGN